MSQYTGTIIYFVVIAAVFYFLIIRPNQQRQRDQAALIAGLNVGDRVVTAGGVYGSIRGVHDDVLELEISDGVIVDVAKAAVARKVEA